MNSDFARDIPARVEHIIKWYKDRNHPISDDSYDEMRLELFEMFQQGKPFTGYWSSDENN